MHPLLNIAVRAARRAGEIIARSIPRLESLEVTAKGRNDFVSEIDRESEAAIVEIIHQYYPHHAILAEEGGASGEHDIRWVIDPLDGTTNFLHGLPIFAVSIACEQKGVAEVGVVYDVMRQEVFTAARGAGAHLENHRMRVSKARSLEGALLATGFPYRASEEHTDAYMAMMRAFMKPTAGIRRPGAAALDLAYVAAGRVDGFWEIGLQPWDTAAGTLLVREAGGRVGTLSGADYENGGNLVAAAPKVYEAMLATIAPHLSDSLRTS
jgi:myo-inositol-1(or 4)-monophosphatase